MRVAVIKHRRLLLLSLSLFSLLLWPVARLESLIVVGTFLTALFRSTQLPSVSAEGFALKKSVGIEIAAAFWVVRWVCAACASEHPAAGEADLLPRVSSLGSGLLQW